MDVVRYATGRALVPYPTLFVMEAIILGIAFYLSTRLDINATQAVVEELEYVNPTVAYE